MGLVLAHARGEPPQISLETTTPHADGAGRGEMMCAARMKKMPHTPEPWGWSDYLPGDADYAPEFPCVGPEDSDDVIAYIDMRIYPEEVWQANARLMAAAPELLEQCEYILEHGQLNGLAWAALRKVIDKARGS